MGNVSRTSPGEGAVYEGAPCKKCGSTRKYANKNNRGRCVACHSPARKRNAKLWKYGEDGVSRLASQGGLCAVCRKPLESDHAQTHIDHCHDCNGVRSILCHNCNALEGHATKLGDPIGALRRLVAYLDHHWSACPDHDGRPVATGGSRI